MYFTEVMCPKAQIKDDKVIKEIFLSRKQQQGRKTQGCNVGLESVDLFCTAQNIGPNGLL